MTKDISNEDINPPNWIQELKEMHLALIEQLKEANVEIGVLRSAVFSLVHSHHNPEQLSKALSAHAAGMGAGLSPESAQQYAAAMQQLQDTARAALLRQQGQRPTPQ